jgi:hypothetical protein
MRSVEVRPNSDAPALADRRGSRRPVWVLLPGHQDGGRLALDDLLRRFRSDLVKRWYPMDTFASRKLR